MTNEPAVLSNFDPIAIGDEIAALETEAQSKARTKMIRLDDIVVSADRMRQLRPEKVDEFAESIAVRGQLQPIIVRPRGDTDYLLVVGSHRLEAVRKLGHEAIECRVLDGMDADQALLAEIDENLVRADLTPSERAAHHAKRKQLYLKLHPETEKGKAGGRPRKTSDKMSKVSTRGYAKAAAKKVGKTSRTVARDVSRGEKIDPQALADLAGTCLDNGTELDALAKLPAAEQRSLAEAGKRGEKVSAIACGPEAPKTSDDTGEARSTPSRRKKADLAPRLDPRAWSMSTPQEREAFVKTVGRSEFEDALNAIESGCKLARGLNSLNQAWKAATEPERRTFCRQYFEELNRLGWH